MTEIVSVRVGEVVLSGILELPTPVSVGARQDVIIFAHGSGSSRLSPRNQMVASRLNRAGLGTLLFDLLTEDESANRSLVFDIEFLASRLVQVTHWLQKQEGAFHFRLGRLGYFGASTGAAAALRAASELGNEISAIVSRGGRPDLASAGLHWVTAPTLLIVGGEDHAVIEMNREAFQFLNEAKLIVIPGATHLFEEPNALEQVAQEATHWFMRFLSNTP
jgi:dienelactone hydrolase